MAAMEIAVNLLGIGTVPARKESPSRKGGNKYEYAKSHYDTGVRR